MWKSKFYGAFVLNHRVVLHAIDAMPARWRDEADSSLLDRARTAASSPRNDLVKNCRVHPIHWLISTQASRVPAEFPRPKYALAAGRADVSSAARRVPGSAVRAADGSGARAGAFSKTVAVARAVAAAKEAGRLSKETE